MTHIFRIFLFVTLFVVSISSADASKRVALVIGNSAYEHTSKLKNPTNDAQAVSVVLKGLGFEVIQGLDLTKAELEKKMREFSKLLDKSGTGLLFYAGHGLQVDGVNYLVPVDGRVETEDDLDFELVPLHQLLKRMERKSGTNLIFLDACRNNPITRSLAANMGTRSTAVGRGLARVDAGIGTLVSFATQPGNVALDGGGDNSPFAEAILRHFPTPDLDVVLMMRRVRRDVLKATGGKQVPWTNSSLTDSFFFTASVPSDGAVEAENAEPSKFMEVSTAYKSTQEVGTCEAYEAFEKSYPGTLFTDLSKAWRTKNCGPSDPRELTRSLQSELKRVGCNPGTIDGVWGGNSRNALATFNKLANLNLDTGRPSLDALNAVRAKTSIVCPPRPTSTTTTTTANKPAKTSPTKVRKATSPGSKKTSPSSWSTYKPTGRQVGPAKLARESCRAGNLAACERGCRKGSSAACAVAKKLRGG